MAQLHATALHGQAKDLLSRHEKSPKKLVLFHALLALGIPLLVALVNYLLSLQIAKTGGLDGMATRSVLETAQSVLETGLTILLPFWQVGLVYAAMQWRKGFDAAKSHLLEGFRRFVNVFALRFWTGVLFVFIGVTAFYVSLFIFTATPWSKPVTDLISPTGQALTPEQVQELLTPELMQQLIVKMVPLFILFGVLFAVVCTPLFYRLRLADFILLEGEGGRRAMGMSLQLTKGNCLQIFKLDLHFWWYYLLQGLCAVICYGDTILSLSGVNLPINGTLSFFLFYALGLLLQGILLYRYQAERLTVYALAYDALQPVQAPEETFQEA